jgi:hypothetical protein
MLSSQSGSEAVLLPIESSRASPGEVGEGVWGKVSDESRYVPTAGPSAGWRYGCNLGVDADDLLDQKGRLAVRHHRMRPDEAAGMQGRGGLVARSRVPLRAASIRADPGKMEVLDRFKRQACRTRSHRRCVGVRAGRTEPR